jgi:hypothetical protein
MSTIPPQYAVEPTWLLFRNDLPKAELLTALRIYALGWRRRYEGIPPIRVSELCEICGVSRSTLFAHLSHLRIQSVLRYGTVGEVATVEICRPDEAPSSLSPEIRTGGALRVVVPESGQEPRQQHYSDSEDGARESGNPDSGESGNPDCGELSDDQRELLVLMSQELAPAVAERLVRTRPLAVIERQWEHYCYVSERHDVSAGWLVRAIESDWPVPAEVEQRIERLHPEREAARWVEEAKRLEERYAGA